MAVSKKTTAYSKDCLGATLAEVAVDEKGTVTKIIIWAGGVASPASPWFSLDSWLADMDHVLEALMAVGGQDILDIVDRHLGDTLTLLHLQGVER